MAANDKYIDSKANDKYRRICPICGAVLRYERRPSTRGEKWKNIERDVKEITVTVPGAGKRAGRVRIKVKEDFGKASNVQNTYGVWVCPECKLGFGYKDTLPPEPEQRPDYSKMTAREYKRLNNL